MGADHARSAGNDYQYVASTDRLLLDDAAPLANGEGEQLAPPPVEMPCLTERSAEEGAPFPHFSHAMKLACESFRIIPAGGAPAICTSSMRRRITPTSKASHT